MKGYAVIKEGRCEWVNHDKPKVDALGAILRPIAVAPCSSDVHYMETYDGSRSSIILGHEAVGEIVEVGSLVKRFKAGEIVAVSPSTPDWNNPAIQAKRSNSAHAGRLMSGFKFVGEKDGVFAEFFHINCADSNLSKIPDNVNVKDALMVVDMMNTGFYGAELAEIQFGDTVVVLGIGPVGLMSIAGARLMGAGRIYGVGSRKKCVEMAKWYGATCVIDYKKDDVVQSILELEGKKPDKVIIAGGKADTINTALQLTKPSGIIANVNYFDKSEVFNVPAIYAGLGMSDVTIRGGFCPGGGYRIERLLDMVQAGRIDPGRLISKCYEGFDKIPMALTDMKTKGSDIIKSAVLINW